jgi:SNF2 family DNA or RNA helicase
LDLLEIALEGAGHTYTRIDGSMKSEERTAAMRNLTHDAVPGTRFILCSLKAAGVGINLTRANVCFMMDPWWNASSENQAIDRVHRMVRRGRILVSTLYSMNTALTPIFVCLFVFAVINTGTNSPCSGLPFCHERHY